MELLQLNNLAILFQNYTDTRLHLDNPIVFSIALFLIFALITLLTLRKAVDEQVFSIMQTEQMKGLAIIMVIVSHLYGYVLEDYPELKILRILGSGGVALFLLLSGFGITISLQRKGVKNFFSKRVLRIYIPVVLAMTLEVALNHILLKQNSNIIIDLAKIFTIVSAVDRNLWFIIYILFWYCLIYLAFRINIPNNRKVIFLCCISLILIALPRLSPSWKINAFSFPVGCWLGLNWNWLANKIKFLLHQNILIILGILLSGFLLTPWLNDISDKFLNPGIFGITSIAAIASVVAIIYWFNKKMKISDWRETISFCLVILAMISYSKWVLNDVIAGEQNVAGWMFGSLACLTLASTIILLISLMVKFQVHSIFLKSFGNISYELYLIHGMFLYSYDFVIFRWNILVTFLVYFAAICLGSIALQRLSSIAFDYLSNLGLRKVSAEAK